VTLSDEQIAEIEEELISLQKKEYKRPGVAIQKFIDRYSSLIAQMQTDLNALVRAGFGKYDADKYIQLFNMLVQAYAQRGGVIVPESKKSKYFKEQMVLAAEDKKRLMVVARHIRDVHKTAEIKQVIVSKKNGSGVEGVLTKILELTALVQEYLDTALQIRPDGVVFDENCCTIVTDRALELLKLRGYVVVKGKPKNMLVDKQNRVITLCQKAQIHIKKYARAAFQNDFKYYKENYCSYR
jgi:hypothetical protein